MNAPRHRRACVVQVSRCCAVLPGCRIMAHRPMVHCGVWVCVDACGAISLRCCAHVVATVPAVPTEEAATAPVPGGEAAGAGAAVDVAAAAAAADATSPEKLAKMLSEATASAKTARRSPKPLRITALPAPQAVVHVE